LARNIVRGQKIDPAKAERAKQLRGESTREERLLWDALRRTAIAGRHFRRQQLIAGFVVDFYCHSGALAVEIDGPSHRGRAKYDADRDRILNEQGIRVLRISAEGIARDLVGSVQKITNEVKPNPRPLP
jgi:very-short-patch-repair endonuclease